MVKFAQAAFVILFIVPLAHAQVTVDFAKINCKQFFTMKTLTPDTISIWLSGYYHAKRDSTVVDTKEFEEAVRSLRVACSLTDNLNMPVMQVVEKKMPSNK